MNEGNGTAVVAALAPLVDVDAEVVGAAVRAVVVIGAVDDGDPAAGEDAAQETVQVVVIVVVLVAVSVPIVVSVPVTVPVSVVIVSVPIGPVVNIVVVACWSGAGLQKRSYYRKFFFY